MRVTGEHKCVFDEFEIEPGDYDRESGWVLLSCECGERPVEELDRMQNEILEMDAALLAVDPERALFHWAPTTRRKQIVRRGLVPNRRFTTTDPEYGYVGPVCFATDPSFAWSLSGAHRKDVPSWDLWMTWLFRLTDPVPVPNDKSHDGLHEIRTMSRVYKRDLWLVGTRT